mgnify:CR=1 FL=1
MKTFKQRIVNLINDTKLESVNEATGGIFTTTLSGNDQSLRVIILENLQKIKQHSSLISDFLKTEQKIDELNDIGISEALNDLLQPDIIKSNPFLGTALTAIKNTYDNKIQPAVFIVEQLLNTIKPFDYLPQIDNHIKKITNFIKENNEDLTLLRGKLMLQNSKNTDLFSNVITKIDEYIYDNSLNRKELLGEMIKYKFEPTVQELITVLQKEMNANTTFELNENSKFSVKPINSFIFVNEDNSKTFAHNGVFYNITKNNFEVLSEEKYNQLPSDFILISKYLNSGKISINENTVTIKVGNEKIAFTQQVDGSKKAFLNEREILTNEPRAFLAQSGLFTKYSNDLTAVNKIWENINTLITIDFGKQIQSTQYAGLNATLYKINETYYVHVINPAMNINDIKEGTCLQIRNAIVEHMGYDISETLYEFLEGDQAEIAKLRNTQIEIQNAIELLNEQFKKIDLAKQHNILPAQQLEASGIVKTINEQIDALKNKYNQISVTIIQLQDSKTPDVETRHDITGAKTFVPKYSPNKNFKVNYNCDTTLKDKLESKISKSKHASPIGESTLDEGDVESIVKDDGSLKVNDQVRVKSSGIVAKVTGINGITGQVTLVTDEGNTINLPKESLEIIKDELASKLSDIEKIAKKASDEFKGKMSEDFKSFEIEKGNNEFKIKKKVTTAEPNTKDDIIALAKKASSVINNK